eukprot:scaffold6208_cov45-Cyclotella_meneghiniana.AAC.1
MREYFQKAFPRLDFQKDDGIISEDEWERFAKAEGTRFPPCQYSPGLAVWDESGRSGVALVGDAIHAFSPDIGQGVNAGLMDVVCLDRALSGLDPETGEEKEVEVTDNDNTSLGAKLEQYQKHHAPEIAALIRLARFGAPYQYNQPHRADRVLKKLWTANVAMRLILSKLTFGLIQPPCIILSQNGDLTFRESTLLFPVAPTMEPHHAGQLLQLQGSADAELLEQPTASETAVDLMPDSDEYVAYTNLGLIAGKFDQAAEDGRMADLNLETAH